MPALKLSGQVNTQYFDRMFDGHELNCSASRSWQLEADVRERSEIRVAAAVSVTFDFAPTRSRGTHGPDGRRPADSQRGEAKATAATPT
jgi:hypothetical protein